jgi:hypothetical protein
MIFSTYEMTPPATRMYLTIIACDEELDRGVQVEMVQRMSSSSNNLSVDEVLYSGGK